MAVLSAVGGTFSMFCKIMIQVDLNDASGKGTGNEGNKLRHDTVSKKKLLYLKRKFKIYIT